MRKANTLRNTKETMISAALNIDGIGKADIEAPVQFFCHMLELLAAHSLVDIKIRARGDVDVDCHHLIEDMGIAVGQALDKALGTKKGIARYGFSLVPMDEALVEAAVDFSGRPFLNYSVDMPSPRTEGEFDYGLIREFFQGIANNARMTIHLRQVEKAASNHHMSEAVFKAFARALRMACAVDPRRKGIPSSKGKL